MHGILLIDKPESYTSHDIVRKVRRIYSTRKVGHAGTLDPLATGVLAVAVGDGTKILQFLFSDDKRYRTTLQLGIVTDSYDAQGKVVSECAVPEIDSATVDSICNRFRGNIKQLPPMFSALKRAGVPLYKLARQGIEVERTPRPVTIYRLEVIALNPPFVTIEVDCSKGTYIRSLVHDLGEALGCGAHLTSLRRLRSGCFHLDQCYQLATLEQMKEPHKALVPLSTALSHLPAVKLNHRACENLAYGIPPQETECLIQGSLTAGERVRLLEEDHLVAVAAYQPLRQKEKRGDFELIRVFI